MGKKNLTENRTFKESNKNLPYYWVKIIGVFNMEKKRDWYA